MRRTYLPLSNPDGMFGRIKIESDGDSIGLYVNHQRQGGAWMDPSPAVVSPDIVLEPGKPQAGPVPESAYQLGWLLPGIHKPDLRGLMIGLGLGSGATGFLYSFPEAELEIVEIDPAIIEAAHAANPLLQHYENSGRLVITESDASDRITGVKPGEFDVGFADAYVGEDRLVDDYVKALISVCPVVYLNMIANLGRSTQFAEINGLMDVQAAYAAISWEVDDLDVMSNWIVTNAAQDMDAIMQFTPFKGLGGGANSARDLFQRMIRNKVL